MKPALACIQHVAQIPFATPFQSTFPNFTHSPVGILQGCQNAMIPLAGFPDFRSPELLPAFWPFKQRTVMPMPKAAVGENNRPISREYKVRLSGQLPGMEKITEASRMQPFSQHDFRPSVLSFYPRHHPAADIRRDDINHRRTSTPVWREQKLARI